MFLWEERSPTACTPAVDCGKLEIQTFIGSLSSG